MLLSILLFQKLPARLQSKFPRLCYENTTLFIPLWATVLFGVLHAPIWAVASTEAAHQPGEFPKFSLIVLGTKLWCIICEDLAMLAKVG